MVRAKTLMLTGLLTTMLATAGFAVAGGDPLAIVTGEGGGQAAAEITSGYHADASGALDKAEQTRKDLKGQAMGSWYQANGAYEQTRAAAWETVDQAEPPALPQDAGEEQLFDQVDQVSSVQASHTDTVEKAADVETGYVDAGADLSATGSVKGWFKDAFSGLKDAYTSLKGQFTQVDTSASEDVKAQAEEALHADDQLRGEITRTLEQDQPLPEVDPSLQGDLGASHATELTSSVLGSGQVGLP